MFAIVLASILAYAEPGRPIVSAGPIVEQCPGGICLPPLKEKISPAAVDSKYEWVKSKSDQYLLLKDGVTVGQWWIPDFTYYPWDGTKNLPSCKPPIDPPTKGVQAKQMAKWQTNGVHSDKIHGHEKESLSYGGKLIHPTHLFDAFAGKLSDDSGKGYLVIVAKDQAKREAVNAEWQKLPAEFTSRYNVWMVPPDHFSMKDRDTGKPRFTAEGDPTIILQQKDGTVLFRRPQANQSYKASDFHDLLKSDPSYQPALDPGAPVAKPAFSIKDVPTGVWWGVGGVLAILLLRRKS